jgi:hypothetical protein
LRTLYVLDGTGSVERSDDGGQTWTAALAGGACGPAKAARQVPVACGLELALLGGGPGLPE